MSSLSKIPGLEVQAVIGSVLQPVYVVQLSFVNLLVSAPSANGTLMGANRFQS